LDLLNIPGLTFEQIRELAFECCFMKRRAKKIDASYFLALMCIESQKGSPSYNELSARFDTVYNISASKQAMWKKVNQACVVFFQTILAHVIKHRVSDISTDELKAFGNYKRIIVQDSTIIKLPLSLFDIFSGVSNAHKAVCNARLQGVYDLISGEFIYFSIDPYSKNDLLAAPELDILPGDLVLRDRGYYKNDEMQRHIQAGADCIYRYKYKTTFLDLQTKEPIDLTSLLEKMGKLDMLVCLNNKNQTKVRVVAVPVSQEVANIRKMKAKKESKGHNPSQGVLKLMEWTIFITNISTEEADFDKLFKIYRLRWRIEIIYKIWKSHMAFAKLHQVSYNQLQVILTARLIMIVICTHKLFKYFETMIYRMFKTNLSMMKFMNYLMKNTEKICDLLIVQECDSRTDHDEIFYKIKRYCSYDKRKRLNHCQLFDQAFLS
jgi:hypothetical protein